MANVDVISPEGEKGTLPQENLQAGIARGFKPAVRVTSPEGTAGWIPQDSFQTAKSRGFLYTPAVPKPQVSMQSSATPAVVRGVTDALPAIGAITGGAVASPGVVTTPLGTGLGAAAGESARLNLNRAIFGKDEPSAASAEGLKSTAVQGAVAAGTEGVLQGVAAIPRRVATAPVRLAVRSTEAAANQKIAPIKPVLKIMTPADEAENTTLKLPGRDYGLAKSPNSRPGSPATKAPEASPSEPGLVGNNYTERAGSYSSGEKATPAPESIGKTSESTQTAKPEPSAPAKSSSAPRVLKGDEARDFIQKQQAPLENQSTSKPAGAQPPNGNNKVTNLPDGFTPLEGSSALKGFKYNFKTEELEVISKDGAHYVHDNVPAEQARQFAASDSPGTFWNKNLRGGAEGRENASTFKMVGGERVKIPKAVKDVPNPFETPEWKASNAADQAAQKQSAAENGGKLNLQRAQQLKDQANGIRVSSQGGLHQVLSGTNKNSGILLAQDVPDNPGAARVAVHWVDEGIRGQGQGTKQLETLAQHLKASGKTTLFSDRDMTDAARGTWDKISAAHPGAITKTPAGYTFDLTKLKQ